MEAASKRGPCAFQGLAPLGTLPYPSYAREHGRLAVNRFDAGMLRGTTLARLVM